MTERTPEPSPQPSSFDRRDFLWKTLVRFDFYVGTTISRAAAVTALNALVVGGIVIKAGEILASFGSHTCLRRAAVGALGVATVAALVSTALSFFALIPYRGTGKLAGGESLVFFAHVGARTRAAYVSAVESIDSDGATREIAEQVHDMAVGLRRKFRILHAASWCTVLFLLPALAVLGGSVFAAVVLSW